MSDQRSSVDLTTLAEVQRLLASTDFASIDDLARRAGVVGVADGVDRAGSALGRPAPAMVESAGATPLPRRR